MKKLLFSFLMVSVCFLGNAQLTAVTVEEIPLTGFVGATDFTGYTNYRLYAEVADPADQVTAVIGGGGCDADVSSTTSFYRNAAAAVDPSTGSLNPFFFGFVPDVRYSSAVGIGLAASGTQGVTEGEDPNGSVNPLFGAVDGLGAAISGSTNVIGDGFAAFPAGGNIVINTFTGGAWLSTPGANTIGFGVNNSVFLGSFTTDGEFSFNISVGIQDDIIGTIDYINCDPANSGLGLAYPAVGCTNELACNYDAAADVDDSSCVFATGCDVCDGVGGVTDNPEEGDLCDDSDAGTENDMIQADCSCAGTPVAADPCSTAIDVSAEGTFNSGAIAGDLDATIGSCFNVPSAMNWFFYTATADGEVTVSSFGIGGTDSEVAAATGTCAGGLTEIACNQDFSGFPYESEITFAVTNGETYYIVWGNGWDDAAFDFTVTFALPAVVPANDLCDNAEALATDGTLATGDNTAASATADDFGNDSSPDVWYSFLGTGNTVVIETFPNGGMTDSRIAVTDACGNASLDSDDDGGTGAMSLISLCTTLGTTYFVEVQGYGTTGGSLGSFDISVTDGGLVEYCSDALASNYNAAPGACDVENNATCIFTNPGCQDPTALNYDVAFDTDCANVSGGSDTSCCTYPPSNDLCANATPLVIDGGAISGTNVDASDEDSATDTDASCWGTDGLDGDVWYSFPGTGGLVTISTANFDTQIAVYDACEGNLVGCGEDEAGFPSYASEVADLCTALGTTYYVEVEGWNGGEGAFDISLVTSGAAPTEYCGDPTAANYNATPGACDVQNDVAVCVYVFDGCGEATALVVDAAASTGDNTGTTDENFGAEPACFDQDGAGDGDVWFSFAGTGGLVDIETFDNGGMDDSQIAVYSDCAGTLVDCNEDKDLGGGDYMSLIEGFCAEAGTTYYVEVEGWGTTAGSFDISVVTSGAAADEYCGDPTASNYNATATACDVLNNTLCTYAPANDEIANAEVLTLTAFGTCTSVPGTNVGSTDSGESDQVTYEDVWYSFIADEAGLRVEVASGDIDLYVELYDAVGFLLDQDNTGFGGTEVMYADAVPGTEYFVSVSGWNGAAGTFEICAQELPASEVYGPNVGQVYPCSGYRGLSSTTGVSVVGGGTDWTFDDGVNTPITYSTPNSSVNLDVVPGLQPGTTYAVSIVPYYDNFGVSSQGTNEITIAAPSTGLKSQYENATVALSQNAYVRCLQFSACGYESFDWRITDMVTGVVSNVSTPGDLLALTNITDVTYGREYTAEIAVVYNGGVVGAYGAPQTFFTGAVPLIQLQGIYWSSNTTLTLSQYIRATPKVYLATDYEWFVERTDITELPFTYLRGIANRAARVSDIGLAAGGTYNISIKPIVPNQTTEYGIVREAIVVGAGMVQDDEDTSPEIQEETVVKDNVISAAVTMYPNPAKDFVTLNITGIAEGTDKVLVAIFNTVGQLVQSEQIPADGNYVNSVVTLNGLAEGMYNVQITVGNTVSTERMIIQK